MCWALILVALTTLHAQDVATPDSTPSSAPSSSTEPSASPAPSPSEKWRLFVSETVSPLTLGAAAFNASVSQITRSAPLYGRDPWPYAYPKRIGASIGDIVSENFFSDFLLASAFREDTRYVRKGEQHPKWARIEYAISRSVVTRTDSGQPSFNWANVLGNAMSATLSNAYYPRHSRTLSVSLTNWGTGVAGSGLVNLLPEFLPDFKRWAKRRVFHISQEGH